MLKVLVLLSIGALAGARQFNTPLLSQTIGFPAVTKFKGSYYLIDKFEIGTDFTFPILVSTDLQNWVKKTVKISAQSSDAFTVFYEPEIHVLSDDQFRLYFRRYHQGFDVVTAAFAVDILGPYYISEEPVISSGATALHPTFFNSSGVFYMAWSENQAIYGQRLRSDGLSVSDERKQLLLSPTLKWEDGFLLSPSVVNQGEYFYLFYSAVMNCAEKNGIGVARSLFPLGPYTKLGDPFVINDLRTVVPKFPNIVKDVDDKSDVLLYGGHKSTDTCTTTTPDYVIAKSITWTKDAWPSV